jgi:hypothetical protein
MRPSVFVSSSSEGLPVAYALQSKLERDADVTVWDQDVFRASQYVLESLLKQLDNADLGIFVFSPDDLTRMRGAEDATVRDNVVFEFGLFVGRLGRQNSIIVSPRNDEDFRLPSDLLGINVLKYQSDRGDGNLEAAVGPASNAIRAILRNLEPKGMDRPSELLRTPFERRGLLTGQQVTLLNLIEASEPCPRSSIEERFSGMSKPELFYRLEHLRLLMLITSSSETSDGGVTTENFSLTDSYRRAFRAARVRTTAPPPPPHP